ncbi:LysR family regulator CbbR [Profundibacter sp.]|uniref:LysR family regulator CbbR n=1 Tax=Profundibacter sp. TaxID=3101071 RepID=UPI003D0A80CA
MPKLDAVTFKQLRAIRAVAENGTLSAAAEAVGLTPPAIHTQLRILEENLGCKLVDRGGAQGARLTAEGQAVLRAEFTVHSALENCLQQVRALRDGQSGVVVLGVVSTGKYFAPGLVAMLQQHYPDIDVVLRVGNRDAIMRALQQQALDLVIMGRPPRSPIMETVVIGDHPHVMIAAPEHPLAGRKDITAQELLAQTFIAREEGSGTRIMMIRYLDRIGEGTPYRSIEMGTNETIKQAVIAGLGVALISQHTVTEELRTGRLATIESAGLPIARKWFLLHRQDLRVTPAIATVHRFISDLEGSFLPKL